MKRSDPFDPKGLMKDAFIIDGITMSECRSIFLDWVLGVPEGRDVRAEVAVLLTHYESLVDPAHPMLVTLASACEKAEQPRRRGGRQSRLSQRKDEV